MKISRFKINRLSVWVASGLLAAVFASGCAQNGDSNRLSNPSDQVGAPEAPGDQRSGRTSFQGTGDLGGGNGVDNKPFESYAVDITKTREWTDHLAAIDLNMSKAFDGSMTLEEGGGVLFTIAKRMKWYIVPMKLEEIPKERIGLTIARDPVQQLAIQNGSEIWIEKQAHDASDSRARATLYLHEIVMALYKTQFMTLTELCLRVSPETQTCDSVDSEQRAAIEELYKPTPYRDMSDADYANIRAMTDWLKAHKDTITEEALWSELRRYGFDLRFRPNKKSEKEKSEKVSDLPTEWTPKMLEQAYKNSLNLGHFPKSCTRSSEAKVIDSCDVALALGPETDLYPYPGSPKVQEIVLTLKLKRADRGADQGADQSSVQTSEIRFQKAEKLFSSSEKIVRGLDEGKSGVGVYLQGAASASTKEGDLVYMATFFIGGSKKLPLVQEIVLVPYRVMSIEREEQNFGIVLTANVARPNEAQDPVIVVSKNGKVTPLVFGYPTTTYVKTFEFEIKK